MKDAIARERIDALYAEIRELKKRTEYYEPLIHPKMDYCPVKVLSAYDIILRFDELYELLGVERNTVPGRTDMIRLTISRSLSLGWRLMKC